MRASRCGPCASPAQLRVEHPMVGVVIVATDEVDDVACHIAAFERAQASRHRGGDIRRQPAGEAEFPGVVVGAGCGLGKRAKASIGFRPLVAEIGIGAGAADDVAHRDPGPRETQLAFADRGVTLDELAACGEAREDDLRQVGEDRRVAEFREDRVVAVKGAQRHGAQCRGRHRTHCSRSQRSMVSGSPCTEMSSEARNCGATTSVSVGGPNAIILRA